MKLKYLYQPLKGYRAWKSKRVVDSPNYWQTIESHPKVALDAFWYLQKQYPLDWKNPRTIDEKIFWLAGMTNTSQWTKYADKYLVRQYIEELGLGDLLTKLYGVWGKVEDIDFNLLPEKFVLKCNHDCGSTIVCHNKAALDIVQVRKRLQECLEKKHGFLTCEPHYVHIHPLVIAEELLEDSNKRESSSLVDYKFFCCDGKAQCCMVCYNRTKSSAIKDIYSIDTWQRYYGMSEKYLKQSFPHLWPRPAKLNEMVMIAESISKNFPFLRVDLYNVNNDRIVFGEMTFTPHGGLLTCFNQKAQIELGNKITLPLQM